MAKTKNEITTENCNCKIEDKIPSEKITFFKNNLFRNYNDESTNEEEENPAKRLKLQNDTTIEVWYSEPENLKRDQSPKYTHEMN